MDAKKVKVILKDFALHVRMCGMTRVEPKYDEYIEKIAQLLPKEKAPVLTGDEWGRWLRANYERYRHLDVGTMNRYCQRDADHIHYTEGK